VLRQLLTALDEVRFSEFDDFSKSLSEEVVPRLFAGAAEALRELSPELAGDEKVQLFIRTAAQGISQNIFRRMDGAAGAERENALYWGELVLHSLISNAATYVVESPQSLFRLNEAQAALIQHTGQTLLSLILDEENGQIRFEEALTVESLDAIVRATLEVLAEHPDLVTKHDMLREVVSGVSLSLAASGIQRPDLLPELVRLVLEESGRNLHLLWDVSENSPENLLIVTLRQLLFAISEPDNGNDRWRPRLNKAQLLEFTQDVFDEVIENPVWITGMAEQDSLLAEVLESTLKALEKTPRRQRLSWETTRRIIQLNMRVVASSPQVLKRIDIGTDAEEEQLLQRALDLIFAYVFPKDQQAGLDKPEILIELLEYFLEVVLQRHPDRKGLLIIRLMLDADTGLEPVKGLRRDYLDHFLDAALEVLGEHPELIAGNYGLQEIIAQTAMAVRRHDFDRPGLLEEIIPVLLHTTSGQLDRLLHFREGQPEHLLVTALEQLFAALAKPSDEGPWRPRLTTRQLLEIGKVVMQEVADNPAWVEDRPLLHRLVESVLDALNGISVKSRLLNAELFRMLLVRGLEAVALRRQMMMQIHFPDGSKGELVITFSLQQIILVLHEQEDSPAIAWTVSQMPVLEAILDYFFDRISRSDLSPAAVEEGANRVREALTDYREGLIRSLEELLEILERQL